MTPGFLLMAASGPASAAPAGRSPPLLTLGNVSIWVDSGDNPEYLRWDRLGRWTVIRIGEFYSQSQPLAALLQAVEERTPLPEGQYCAALVDEQHARVVLVTDPLGIRSLFYRDQAGCLTVATSPRYFRQAARYSADTGGECKETTDLRDVSTEAYLLRFGYLPPVRSVYRGVNEAPANALIEWQNGELKQPVRISTPPARVAGAHAEDPAGYRDSLYSLLQSIVRKQAGEHRKVGLLLGGFDSALVAALLRQAGSDVETYSFAYGDDRFNQPHTDTLADFLGIRHHWIAIDHDSIRAGLENFGTRCPFPTLWPGYVIQTQALVSVMREHGLQRCFSGDGCDTAFMGYPSTHKRGQVYKKFPHLRRGLLEWLIRSLDSVRAEHWLGHPARVLKGLLRAAETPALQRAFRSFQIFDPGMFPRLTGATYSWQGLHEQIIRQLEVDRAQGSFEKQVYLAKSLFSPNRCKLWSSQDVLQGLICSPYLDPELKAFATALPDAVFRQSKDSSDIGKQLLVDMALEQQLLPAEIINQPKLAAVASPIDHWFAQEIRTSIMQLAEALPFTPDSAYLKSLVDDLPVERFYRSYLSSDQVVGLAIALLVTYAGFFGEPS